MQQRHSGNVARWLGGLLPIAALACIGGLDLTVGRKVTRGDASAESSVVDEPRCEGPEDCVGGVCLNGRCCASAARVCGATCCGAHEICFAQACLRPGKVCHKAGDCDAGQYCEPGLGPAAEASERPNDRVCLGSAPAPGRCVSLPPECAGGMDEGDGTCLPACEYHPQPVPLEAEVAWHWGGDVEQQEDHIDVWSTPVVGRLYDTNCDGAVDEIDPPNVVFVSGDVGDVNACSKATAATQLTSKTGVLRMVDGVTGKTIWSLPRASEDSMGFAGFTVALGDTDGDGDREIVAATGEGKLVVVSAGGRVERISEEGLPQASARCFGWGGGLALADMDGDGFAEVAYGSTVFTTGGKGLTKRFSAGRCRHYPCENKGGGEGGRSPNALFSTFVDLDAAEDGHLELLAGNSAYKADGSVLWQNEDLPDGFTGVADFDDDGAPEVVLVARRNVWILEGRTGKVEIGPLELPLSNEDKEDNGGPPTIADFDGDGRLEIGVALRLKYVAIKPDYGAKALGVLWTAPNHDLSSSVTGSTVFDFEGDGSAEVVYNDECFLWVYDGKSGKVRFAKPTLSFTGTEASMVADVDGDGHAEMLMVANGVRPGSDGWGCDMPPWNQPDPKIGRPAWTPPARQGRYRGITLWRDVARSWVGTRTLWNQHTYHVTNICDPTDSACEAPNRYGAIPKRERSNWNVPWLNNFRQNVQEKGLFDAPDATVKLGVECKRPVVMHAFVRNMGRAMLPRGVRIGLYMLGTEDAETHLGTVTTSVDLFPGQATSVVFTAPAEAGTSLGADYRARIIVNPDKPRFRECRDDNNASSVVSPACLY